MIRKFYTAIKSGKLVDNSGVFTRWLAARKDGECLITIATGVDATDPKRSSRQNRYLWGVCYKMYLEAMIDVGDTTAEEVARELHLEKLEDAVHEILLYRFAGKECIDHDTGEIMKMSARSSTMNTKEIGVYWNHIREDAMDRYGVDIPPPPENVFEDNEQAI